MRRFSFQAVWAMAFSVSLACLVGCGGGSGSTTTTGTAPSITSFTASPATITAGASVSLTGVFSGGTGVITPGNLTATSGTAVSVSPTATTTYTLTVTASDGTAVTKAATVTVNAAVTTPSITSFTASPATITAGGSTSLTGVFTGGTGVITPGNLTAASGTAVTVSPTATTSYTLTVTNSAGTAATQTATVTVTAVVTSTVTVTTPATTLKATDKILGMNLATWYDVISNKDAITSAFGKAGIKAVRWPGGSWSDIYHWSTNTNCFSSSDGSPVANDTFANFVSDIVTPANLDLALTANYGSNTACTGGGDPAEAAAWVAKAKTLSANVTHVTVGNEVYGASWEEDLHTPAHDPATYATAVAGASGYYNLIKAADSSVKVGVVVEEDNVASGWDNTVLANANGYYDFVEYHDYPETPGSESDSYLVTQAAQDLTKNINTIKAEMAKWGTSVPIYVGEIGGAYSNPGKQSWSITQGLYAGQVLGEMMNDGVERLTWWIGFGNCNGAAGNLSASLYGWQDFGAYNVFADGAGDTGGTGNYPCDYGASIGTMSPTARAFQLFSNVAVSGEDVLTATVSGDTADVRAYAATHDSGNATAVAVFNLNETTSEPVTISVPAPASASKVTIITYDKSIYDLTGSPTGVFPDANGTSTWADPTTTTITSPTLPLTLTLTPWSMNIVIVE